MMKIRSLEIFIVIVILLNIPLWFHIFTVTPVSENNDGTEISVAQAAVTTSGFPSRLIIPSINVDSLIERVGITSAGSMGVPSVPMNVGWYEMGVRPGEIGSAVMDGHVDWYGGVTGVFADLEKLKTGDQIIIQDDQGSQRTFIVREARILDAQADATDVFISNDGQSHLNLVTCSGIWDRGAKQYTTRLVIFTDLESE